ncbi:hypothetical protein ACQ4M4_24785 [Leptolyngbya sp. AN02str]|uniref:hypothetical protein n=1 Tax=Leptolyngbya sp. AN02str TaxID=3423363 RepID=UPI003D310958
MFGVLNAPNMIQRRQSRWIQHPEAMPVLPTGDGRTILPIARPHPGKRMTGTGDKVGLWFV